MLWCCGCCSCFKPHYKRLVDNIFPADPQDGLNKSNMDKLTFFAMTSPEKLDRIGEYLGQKLSRDISRQRIGFVLIAMEALDTLLVTCHAHSLNLFVESYLKMVQKLLEQNDAELQCVATQSFIKFSNIEEDTPSYHRRYDFFVSKFSAMCHNNHPDETTRIRLRVSGLKGLQGVVRKTVSDDLQVNIWEHTHMDKIVPSLLYNMQASKVYRSGQESPMDEDNPHAAGESVFRDLVCRASFGNINAVIKPVLTHLDNHTLWVPNDFAVKVFKIIMYSVQAQYGYVVVQMLMGHLDKNSAEEPKIKASIVGVLSETVFIAAGGSIGPSVLEVFHALLRHLRVSVESESSDTRIKRDEEHFQEAIINTIGEFANNLPDFQKIEILMFVMGKMPMPGDQPVSLREVTLQTMLMKTLLKVATKYKTVLMTNAFPSAFLDPLIKMSGVEDAAIRKIVQEILHTLIDRHDNKRKLRMVQETSDNDDPLTALSLPDNILEALDLTIEKPPRQDVMFMKKHGPVFHWTIYNTIQRRNNKVDNFEAIYVTMCLICLECSNVDVYVELFRMALTLQNIGCTAELPMTHRCAIQSLVASFLTLQSQMLPDFAAIKHHVFEVIENRRRHANYYLPEMAYNRKNRAASYPSANEMDHVPPTCMFDLDTIAKHLRGAGLDTTLLTLPFDPAQEEPGLGFGLEPHTLDLNKSASEIGSISIDLESQASTPGSVRKFPNTEKVTFEALKKVLELNPRAKEEEEERNRKIYESFKSGPFEDIVARSEAKAAKLEDVVNGILDRIEKEETMAESELNSSVYKSEPVYSMNFPDLFVY